MAGAVVARPGLGACVLALLIARTASWQSPLPISQPSASHGKQAEASRQVASPTSSVDRQGFMRSILAGSLGGAMLLTPKKPQRAEAADLLSDEFEVVFNRNEKVGLSLADFGDKGKYRTYVKGVIRGSQAEAKGIRVPALVVSVNGVNVEGLPASYVVKLFRQAEGEGGGGGP